LFVKRPGQHTGRIDDANTESIDVVPTIADVLGVRIPWHVDGLSVFRDIRRARIHMGTAKGTVRAPAARLLPMREATLRKQLRLFGSGDEKGIYAVGPHSELIGRPVRGLRVEAGSGAMDASVSSKLHDVLRRFHPGSDVVPTPIVGAISGADVGAGTSVAVAVNGRIAAVSPAYRSGPGWAYSALAPESAFRSRANAVAVYVVTGTRGRLTLHRVGGFPS
jgi:hypothetical protein